MSDNGFNLINPLNNIVPEISSSLWGVIKSKLKDTTVYQNITKTIDINTGHKEFKDIIESSFAEATRALDIPTEHLNELREAIFTNQDLLLDWFFKEPYPQFELGKIEIVNYEIKDEIIRLFKSLHYQIEIKRNSTIASSLEQIKSVINESTNTMINSTAMQIAEQNLFIAAQFKNQLSSLHSLFESQKINSNWSISDQLANIENFLNKRNYTTAKVLLESQNKFIDNVSSEEKEKFYELYTNLQLSNYADQTCVIPYLEKLIIHTKDETKRIQRKILLSCIKKEYQECIREIDYLLVSSMVNNEYLVEIRINCLLLSQEIKEANEYIEQVKSFFKKYLFWKVRILNCLAEYNLSYNLVISNSDHFNQKFEYKVLAIETKAYYFVTKYHDVGFEFSEKNTINTLIMDARNLETEIGEDLQLQESLYMSLTFLYRIIYDNEKTLVYFENLKSINPENPNLLRNYPLTLVQANKIEEAFPWFKKYLDIYKDDYFIMDLYYQCLIDKHLIEAIKDLENLEITVNTVQCKSRLVSAYTRNTQLDKAEKLSSELEKMFPENFYVLYSKATLLLEKKCFIEARNILEKLFNTTSIELDKYIVLNLLINTDVTSGFSQFYENDIYNILSLQNKYELLYHFGERLVCLLLLVNNYTKALEIISQIRIYDLVTPAIIRNEIVCYFNTQNFQKVIPLVNELKNIVPLNENDKLIYLRTLYALGQPDEFLKNVDLLPEPKTANDYLLLEHQLRNLGNKQKEVEIAHKAYKKFPNNIKIQENFIESILGTPQGYITDEIMSDAIRCRDIYFNQDSPSKRIKQIKLPENATGVEILEALQKALPKENNFDYQEFINQNNMHISFLTNANFNYLYIWESIKYLDHAYIHYSTGRQIDFLNENRAAICKQAVIDLPSLISCYYLNILDFLPLIFDKVYLSQQTINEIEAIALTERNPYLSDIHSVFYQLNNHQNPREQIDWSSIAIMVRKIKEFISKSFVEIVGYSVNPKITFPKKLEDLLFMKEHRSIEAQAIKFAYEEQIPIMLECYPYRVLLRNEHNNPGSFCIDSLLARLFIEKHISINNYCCCLAKLIDRKYRCLVITGHIIFDYIKYNGYVKTDVVLTLLNSYSDTTLFNSRWVFEQISIFLAKIWNSDIPYEKKDYWSTMALNVLAKRGDILISAVRFMSKTVYEVIKTNQYKNEFRTFWKSLSIQ